jgi:hypothetical protein
LPPLARRPAAPGRRSVPSKPVLARRGSSSRAGRVIRGALRAGGGDALASPRPRQARAGVASEWVGAEGDAGARRPGIGIGEQQDTGDERGSTEPTQDRGQKTRVLRIVTGAQISALSLGVGTTGQPSGARRAHVARFRVLVRENDPLPGRHRQQPAADDDARPRQPARVVGRPGSRRGRRGSQGPRRGSRGPRRDRGVWRFFRRGERCAEQGAERQAHPGVSHRHAGGCFNESMRHAATVLERRCRRCRSRQQTCGAKFAADGRSER